MLCIFRFDVIKCAHHISTEIIMNSVARNVSIVTYYKRWYMSLKKQTICDELFMHRKYWYFIHTVTKNTITKCFFLSLQKKTSFIKVCSQWLLYHLYTPLYFYGFKRRNIQWLSRMILVNNQNDWKHLMELTV